MTISFATLSPWVSIFFGILVLVFPKFLNYLVSGYLIVIGVLGLGLIN